MRVDWASLGKRGQALFSVTSAFLNGRLEERATIDWALGLGPKNSAERMALLYLLDSPNGREISEPWRSAWRLIEESWSKQAADNNGSITVYDVRHRLSSGERFGSLVGRNCPSCCAYN